MVAAVVFDMDGVIIDSEQVWDDVREQLVRDRGGRYSPQAQRAMMGMSSTEWSHYMHDELGLPQSPGGSSAEARGPGLAPSPEEISDEVGKRIFEHYRNELPLLYGAVKTVRALAAWYPLA